jgi:hypothetical protein
LRSRSGNADALAPLLAEDFVALGSYCSRCGKPEALLEGIPRDRDRALA